LISTKIRFVYDNELKIEGFRWDETDTKRKIKSMVKKAGDTIGKSISAFFNEIKPENVTEILVLFEDNRANYLRIDQTFLQFKSPIGRKFENKIDIDKEIERSQRIPEINHAKSRIRMILDSCSKSLKVTIGQIDVSDEVHIIEVHKFKNRQKDQVDPIPHVEDENPLIKGVVSAD
jgi:hypothetical protein